MKVANLIGSLLNMKVAPGNSSIFVGNKEFEIMKKPGRGTNGHIAIGCNNVDRAIYHLTQRGAKFDLDSKVVKNGKTTRLLLCRRDRRLRIPPRSGLSLNLSRPAAPGAPCGGSYKTPSY